MESGHTRLDPLSPRDPRRVGAYTLLGRLGTGAMGRVYLGKSASGRLVAVKTIKSEFAGEADFRTRFAHEVTAARRVSGVFTAAVVAADSEAEMPWLATAYIPAPSLDQLVRACGPLPVHAVRWLAAGCAEALASIHEAGLVHRDLKPSNVLVSVEGPRVIDFGVARAAERVTFTATHQSVGTPAYMAPEQARDSRRTVAASDVFALGSTLLFAATAHPPYAGESVTDILVRLATEPPDLTGLPAEFAELIGDCLERDPADRPTAAELLERLAERIEADQEFRTAPLPEEALALIEAYRTATRPSVPDDPHDADRTLDSPTSIREPARPSAHRHAAGPPPPGAVDPPSAPGTGDGAAEGTAPSAGRSGRLVRLIAASAAALVVAAAVLLLGMALGGPSGDRSRSPGPPPPGGGGPGLNGSSGSTGIALEQNFGDGNTAFVVHGAGLRAGERVTVRLDGSRTSPFSPVVDFGGTFSYVINQGHEFFPGKIPAGSHHVTVAVSGGHQTRLAFTVNRL